MNHLFCRYFTATAGEHVNKRCKVFELEHTAQDKGRFRYLLHMFRIMSFWFTSTVFVEHRSKLTCSACGLSGHTKKNKICPNHVGSAAVSFEESDDGDD